jgi:hypothetical protein
MAVEPDVQTLEISTFQFHQKKKKRKYLTAVSLGYSEHTIC